MDIRLLNPRALALSAQSGLDRTMRIAAAGAFMVLMVHWAFIVAFVVPRLGALRFLRLHYSAAQGIDWIDDWHAIFTFPALGLAAFFCNVAFAVVLAKRDRLLGRMMMFATVIVELLLAVGGVIAVLLNG
ncbi:MAG TPA: hypothetical protein VL500_02185 [Candidatus Eisenbacteria bacterium]|jgi:hypothetical protein|nr:hypothetical protein [Candidatus Eisenbacteria bacterium]